jgi:hypothetical protein
VQEYSESKAGLGLEILSLNKAKTTYLKNPLAHSKEQWRSLATSTHLWSSSRVSVPLSHTQEAPLLFLSEWMHTARVCPMSHWGGHSAEVFHLCLVSSLGARKVGENRTSVMCSEHWCLTKLLREEPVCYQVLPFPPISFRSLIQTAWLQQVQLSQPRILYHTAAVLVLIHTRASEVSRIA